MFGTLLEWLDCLFIHIVNCVSELGDYCKNDSDCDISEIINEEASRICLDNICTCAIGYSSLSSEDICTKCEFIGLIHKLMITYQVPTQLRLCYFL